MMMSTTEEHKKAKYDLIHTCLQNYLYKFNFNVLNLLTYVNLQKPLRAYTILPIK